MSTRSNLCNKYWLKSKRTEKKTEKRKMEGEIIWNEDSLNATTTTYQFVDVVWFFVFVFRFVLVEMLRIYSLLAYLLAHSVIEEKSHAGDIFKLHCIEFERLQLRMRVKMSEYWKYVCIAANCICYFTARFFLFSFFCFVLFCFLSLCFLYLSINFFYYYLVSHFASPYAYIHIWICTYLDYRK